MTYEMYLIMVGIRNSDFEYPDEALFKDIDYFKRCHKNGMSAYKALLFLNDYLQGDYKI